MSKPEVGRKYKAKMADRIRGLCVGDVLTLTKKYSDGPCLTVEFDNDEHAFAFGPNFPKTFDDWFELVEEPEMTIEELLSECKTADTPSINWVDEFQKYLNKKQQVVELIPFEVDTSVRTEPEIKMYVDKNRNGSCVHSEQVKLSRDKLMAVNTVFSIDGNTIPNTHMMEEINLLRAFHQNLMDFQPSGTEMLSEWLELHEQTTSYLAHKLTQDALGYEICERQMLETLCVMFAEKWGIERFQTFSIETTDLLLINILDLLDPDISVTFEEYGLTVSYCPKREELVFVVGCVVQ